MKKITKMLVLLSMIICLSGCMKVKVEMDVKSSTEMSLRMDYLVEEKFLTMAGMTRETFIEQMKESMGGTDDSVVFTPKSETIDGNKWEGFTITGPFKASEVKEILVEKEIDGKKCVVLTLKKDFMSGDKFGGMDTDKITQQTGYSIDKLKALGMEMNIVVNMPAKATTNFGKADGNKVTIDLLELATKGSNAQDIEISSPLTNGFDMTYILIGVGAVALIGIVVLILKSNKKPKNDEVVNLVEPNESQLPAQEVKEESTQETEIEETNNEVNEESTQEDEKNDIKDTE